MLRRPHLRKCVSRLLARPGKLESSLQEWEFVTAEPYYSLGYLPCNLIARFLKGAWPPYPEEIPWPVLYLPLSSANIHPRSHA